MKTLWLLFAFLFLAARPAQAGTRAVLQLTNYDIDPSAPMLEFDLGNGADGVFDNTTYANFSVAGDLSGNTIRLDTDLHQTLQVTSFTLDAGWKLIPVGSHPLIIKSLGSVRILGEIHCEGTDGGNSTIGAAGTGGSGRCGGAAGGDGGLATLQGASGLDADTLVTGGGGGKFAAGTATGGGGGGSWSSAFVTATNGPNASVANGGLGGQSHADAEFSILKGGAGGGGGSGDAANHGGGGGGGGGVVIIRAAGDVDLGSSPADTTGFIYAHGGKGGNALGNAGPGGGGGGGAVQIFTGGTLNFYNTDASGASHATRGASGTNGGAATGALGAMGRSWIATPTFFTGGTGHYDPTEESPATVGQTELIVYTPPTQDEFNFKAAGCGRIEGGAPPPQTLLLLLLAPLMLLILRVRQARGLR